MTAPGPWIGLLDMPPEAWSNPAVDLSEAALDDKPANASVEAQGTSAARGAEADAAGCRPDASARDRQEALLDEAIEETFPASDPVSVIRVAERGDLSSRGHDP